MLYLDSQFDQFRLTQDNEEQDMDTDESNNAKIHFQKTEFLNKESKNDEFNVKLIVPNNVTDLITDDERDSNMSL